MSNVTRGVISVRSLSKRYGGVQALNNLDLDLERNIVHAIVGENGAGKSTFMKILSGGVTPDSGTIEIDGEKYPEITVSLARKLGISRKCLWERRQRLGIPRRKSGSVTG